MQQQDDDSLDRRAALSALMDGDAHAADAACAAWRGDEGARRDWHTYHLIGDVLRSDEHRAEPARDAAFLGRLRERLAAEPVVLAPMPLSGAQYAKSRRRRGWALSGAVAAGFAAVAGVMVVMRAPEPGVGGGATLATAPGGAVVQVGSSPVTGASGGVQGTWPEQATLIRSSELDRYLAAHRQYSTSSTLALPGGAVRSVSVAEPAR